MFRKVAYWLAVCLNFGLIALWFYQFSQHGLPDKDQQIIFVLAILVTALISVIVLLTGQGDIYRRSLLGLWIDVKKKRLLDELRNGDYPTSNPNEVDEFQLGQSSRMEPNVYNRQVYSDAANDVKRPKIIQIFELINYGMIVIGVLTAVIFWETIRDNMAAKGLSFEFLAVMNIIGFALNVLIIFYIARKGNVIAKWLFVIFSTYGLIFSVLPNLNGSGDVFSSGSTIVTFVMALIAFSSCILLFLREADDWFVIMKRNRAA